MSTGSGIIICTHSFSCTNYLIALHLFISPTITTKRGSTKWISMRNKFYVPGITKILYCIILAASSIEHVSYLQNNFAYC